MHVHVMSASGEAKFWLEPQIEVARNYRLTPGQLREAREIIEEHQHDFRDAWARHFGG
jgi:hypothetical protein